MARFLFILFFTFYGFSVKAQIEGTLAELGAGAMGLVVSDIDISEAFYTEILGMQPAGSLYLDRVWSKEAGMSLDSSFTVRMYKLVNSQTATLLKLAYFGEIEKRPNPLGINKTPDVNYLTFHYDDLQPVLNRIKKAGIEIIGQLERNYSLIIIRDPDGVFIELVQL
ncbi:MAG TPA: VOC family protein [Cyclobacteriaceae bacterium]